MKSQQQLSSSESVRYNADEDFSVIYEYEQTDDEQHRISVIFECLLKGVLFGGVANG